MKTKEELTALKNEVEALRRSLAELSEDELSEVAGGMNIILNRMINCPVCGQPVSSRILPFHLKQCIKKN